MNYKKKINSQKTNKIDLRKKFTNCINKLKNNMINKIIILMMYKIHKFYRKNMKLLSFKISYVKNSRKLEIKQKVQNLKKSKFINYYSKKEN